MDDPFSARGPLEVHVFSLILFLGLLSGGVALLQKPKLNRTRGI